MLLPAAYWQYVCGLPKNRQKEQDIPSAIPLVQNFLIITVDGFRWQ